MINLAMQAVISTRSKSKFHDGSLDVKNPMMVFYLLDLSVSLNTE